MTMLISALVFAALAVLGAAIGLGHVWHPINGQSIDSYGWGLFINGLALAAFFTWHAALAPPRRESKHKPLPSQSVMQAKPDLEMAAERSNAAAQPLFDLGEGRIARRAHEPSQATVIVSDNPDAILDALVERVGTAGVELMLRNRAKFAEAAE
jgi:hypothetical protein